ncbi:MAG: hypothetical protein C5S48_00110 [Candidatus Methanogaster sp.]|nr:MAG: hypothetical protein C5S48_00110 [ANME-2 cluster archaeon]
MIFSRGGRIKVNRCRRMVDQAEIHRKVASGDVGERRDAAEQLSVNFADLPDKDEAWKDLIRLTGYEDSYLILRAVDALGSAFRYVPDKDEAWKDLHRLTRNEDSFVRWRATVALGSAFQHVPDKDAAWKDLHRLTWDANGDVRSGAADVLGSAFQYVPDKDAVWKDLIRLTRDEDTFVQWRAADALGTAFQHVPDKDVAWEDLHRLTGDKNNNVRAYANHLLGRVSIFKATKAESEDDFESELKNAIDFFERSSKEATYYNNPSSFCLPFYRSFYAITFEKTEYGSEVQRYLSEAKNASEGSKNKETLLEAVENLANALTEAHKAIDFGAMKSDLNACMRYCDRAADLIDDAEGVAPGAAVVLRRGLPIIDNRVREIIPEIQEKAEAVCIETLGTPLKELGLATARSAQELPTQDPLALTKALGNMASIARDLCEYLPTDKKVEACEQLKNLTDMEILEQGAALARVFEYAQENIHIPKIQTVHISETEQEIVRIAVAQISFELTESFPFVFKNKDEVKTKVFSALDISEQDGANIVCLPELCLYEEWIGEIKRKYPDMIVIGGSFYKDNKNICPLIMESDTDTPYQPKITPSPFEHGTMGPRMIPGDRIYRYETRFGKFMILICMDFDDLAHFFRETDIDMIFCPSFNSANERFHNEAHSHVERTPSYILIANTGLHGGTSIFGQLNKNYFGGLADGGCKERKDSTYKLCEVKKGQEEVIIADFNLDHKGAQVPPPSNLNKVIKSVDNIKKIPIQLDRSRI